MSDPSGEHTPPSPLTPIHSENSTHIPSITHAPLHHARSSIVLSDHTLSELGLPAIPPRQISSAQGNYAGPTPANTRRGSLTQNIPTITPASVTQSGVAAPALSSLPAHRVLNPNRTIDRFSAVSAADSNVSIADGDVSADDSNLGRRISLTKGNGKEKKWFVTPPHTPSKPTAGEPGPEKESFRRSFVEMASVGARYADAAPDPNNEPAAKTERRGSEAKGWDEIHARRAAAPSKANVRRSIFIEGDTDGNTADNESSSVMNRYPSTSTHAMKSPHPADSLKSPTTAASSPPPAPKAEKFSFLPKFLKIGGGRKSGGETDARERVEKYMTANATKDGPSEKDTRDRVAHLMAGGEQPKEAKAAFDPDISEYESARPSVEIANASRASLVRPTVVHQGSTSSAPRPMGLKEMLLSEGPAVSPGPSSAKLRSFLGEDIEFKSKREGIVSGNNNVGTLSPEMSGGLNSPSAMDALRSHPTTPERAEIKKVEKTKIPKAVRKVTFPPPDLDVGHPGERNEIRQSIVSTPYPVGYVWSEKEKEEFNKKKKGEEGEDTAGGYETAKEEEEEEDQGKDLLTLVIYSPNSRIPKVREVVIPLSKEKKTGDDSDEKKPTTVATAKEDLDDEKLFKLLRSEYTAMRGKGSFLSARALKSMGIIHYKNIAELRRRDENSPHSQRFSAEKDELVADGLLAHFQEPKLGRKNHRWAEWIGKLPGNSRSQSKTRQRIAVEFTHGWALARVVVAVMMVVVLSVAAAVLWMLFGVESVKGGSAVVGDVVGPVAVRQHGIHGVGGRVAGGVAIGVLVMLFGWTGVGLWVLGSWVAN